MNQRHQQQRSLTRRDVLKRTTLGAVAGIAGVTALSSGAAASQCDAVVPDDYATIQDAVDAASAGDTICIAPGTYNENVVVDTELTLRGQNAPNSANPAVVDGSVSLDASGSRITRVVVTRTDEFTSPGSFTPDPFGIRVTASNTSVTGNVVRGLTDSANNKWGAINAVQVFASSPVSDVTIQNNQIQDIEKEVIGGLAGVKVQADVDGVKVANNQVANLHSAGWVWGVVLTPSGSASGVPSDVTVEDNDISELNDGSEYDVFSGPNDGRDVAPYPGSAFGIDGSADGIEATVRYNNLLAPNGVESKDESNSLTATCNWWGDRSGPTHDDNPGGSGTWALERGNASVEYEPWLNAPSPSRACVGGNDQGNGNSGNGGNGGGRGP